MTLDTATKVREMIEKECQRDSLTDLCDTWGLTVQDFYEFLEAAHNYADICD